MGHDVSSICPKCNLEEETPNHHVGECTYYQALRMKIFVTPYYESSLVIGNGAASIAATNGGSWGRSPPGYDRYF